MNYVPKTGRFSDLSISFYLRSTYLLVNGEHPILMNLRYRGDRKIITTGLSAATEDWLSESGCMKPKARHAAATNQDLVEIVHRTRNIFEKLKHQFEDITLQEIADRIKGNDIPSETLIEYVDAKLKELQSRVSIDLSFTTQYKYQRTARYLKEYLEQKGSLKNIALSRVDQSFLEAFYKFLRTEKKNGHNSSVALLNCLKTILQEAVKAGAIRYNPFLKLPLKQQPVKRDYLTTEEIKKLQTLTGLSQAMEKNKDIFLFACFTGLAYSDIVSLKPHNIIIDPDGSKHIEKYRQKTGIISYIPLLPAAERILLKYSPTDDCRDFVWKVPANSKLNYALKEIGKHAGFSKNLFMHLARHTFATTVTLSNGVPLESVGKMIGHSGMKHLMIYAKIVNSKVKKDMEGVMNVF